MVDRVAGPATVVRHGSLGHAPLPCHPRSINSLTVRLPQLDAVEHWSLPSHGAHGMDIDHDNGVLYVACDGGALVEVDVTTSIVGREWPPAGVPDATFYNPVSALVHVAIGNPGLIQSIDPQEGTLLEFPTALGAKTTALVPPDHLYVFSPAHEGILDLVGA